MGLSVACDKLLLHEQYVQKVALLQYELICTSNAHRFELEAGHKLTLNIIRNRVITTHVDAAYFTQNRPINNTWSLADVSSEILETHKFLPAQRSRSTPYHAKNCQLAYGNNRLVSKIFMTRNILLQLREDAPLVTRQTMWFTHDGALILPAALRLWTLTSQIDV